MKVVDNFLDQQTFDNIQSVMLSPDFPWHYNEKSITPPAPSVSQFIHIFYADNIVRSYYNLINPLVVKLKPKSLQRVKANLNVKTNTIIETGEHTDIADDRFTSAVFFINDNNGYLRSGDKKIQSKANSLVVLKSNTLHTVTTCTDASRRVVINFVYIS